MRTDLIAATLALALTAGGAAAQTDSGTATTAPANPAVGESSQSFGVLHPEAFLQKTVLGADDQPVGRVDDVLLGPDGQPLRLIVSSASGGRTVALDLNRVEVRTDSDALFVPGLTREGMQALPPFQDDGSMTSLNARRK